MSDTEFTLIVFLLPLAVYTFFRLGMGMDKNTSKTTTIGSFLGFLFGMTYDNKGKKSDK